MRPPSGARRAEKWREGSKAGVGWARPYEERRVRAGEMDVGEERSRETRYTRERESACARSRVVASSAACVAGGKVGRVMWGSSRFFCVLREGQGPTEEAREELEDVGEKADQSKESPWCPLCDDEELVLVDSAEFVRWRDGILSPGTTSGDAGPLASAEGGGAGRADVGAGEDGASWIWICA